MTTKKTFYPIIFLCTLFLFNSCKKEEVDLTGIWTLESTSVTIFPGISIMEEYINSMMKEVFPDDGTVKLELKDDNTYVLANSEDASSTEAGTYTTDSKNKKLKLQNGGESITFDYSMPSTNSLILKLDVREADMLGDEIDSEFEIISVILNLKFKR
jgi:hypothetical protein